jgi:hypothetical protein
MVVKPFANLVKTGRGYAQPGIKVRGREYLRIIYGPDYTEPANLERLRDRGLGHKRSSGSSDPSRCGASTSPSSPSWPSSPSRETPDSEPGRAATTRLALAARSGLGISRYTQHPLNK